MSKRSILLICLLALATGALPACRSVYYDVWETFGREKRDLLRTELKGLVGDQHEAEEAYVDALTRLKTLTGFDGGDLEQQYDDLKHAYDDAKTETNDIDSRMVDVRTIGADLFAEWESEIGLMSTPSLKSASRAKLTESKSRFNAMDRSVEEARRQMDPVLTVLHDHVLYLKHNLNAAAVGAIGQELGTIERDIETLKGRIHASIAEAQQFIETMPN